MIITGIDIGTTSICGINIDSSTGEVLRSITKPNNAAIAPVRSFERLQDASAIMKTVRSVLSELTAANTACIGVSGQMHGIVYYDKNGRAVSPLYTWQDERGAIEYGNGKTYAETVGCHTGYGLATHFYNFHNSIVPVNAKGLCTIGDYAVMKLCGRKEAVMHITNAASLGRFDIKKGRFIIENDYLPEVTSSFLTAGEYKGIPVCAALGDNQASFAGSVKDPDSLLINIGTGAQVSYLTDSFKGSNLIEIRPFDGKKNLAAGCSLCGGRAFSMLEKLFREIAALAGAETGSLYPQIDRLLESVDSSSLTADCRFCGTRADGKIRGSFTGIDENNLTAADLAYSVCEGIARELFDMLPAGKTFTGYVGSGNGIGKNAALRRIIEKHTGQKLQTPRCAEEAAYGAALAASVACGIFPDLDSARQIILYC